MSYPGVHVCAVVNSPQEQMQLAHQFVTGGLRKGERILYITAGPGGRPLLHALKKQGADENAFTIIPAQDAYLKGGHFDGRAMVRLIENAIDQSFSDGYPGIRLTGEMSWAVRAGVDSQELLAYETEVDEVLQRPGVIAVCQYQREHALSLETRHLASCHNHIGTGADLIHWL